MITDLHSHTHFSNCGRDLPEELVLEMIKSGVSVLGITDHNHGIKDRGEEYRKSIRNLAKRYQKEITLLCGIEICTQPTYCTHEKDFSCYDYCLIENLDDKTSIAKGDVIGYTKDFGCVVGIAHTDLFKFAKDKGIEAREFFKALGEAKIFWELNVSYDRVHGYREHEYVKEFMKNVEQQRIIKDCGVMLSVGFDGHRKEDYAPKRVQMANDFIRTNGFLPAVDYILKNRKEK